MGKIFKDLFKNGDTLLAIETDKAIMGFEATDSGDVFHIFFPDESKTVQVGTSFRQFLNNQEMLQDLKALVDILQLGSEPTGFEYSHSKPEQ